MRLTQEPPGATKIAMIRTLGTLVWACTLACSAHHSRKTQPSSVSRSAPDAAAPSAATAGSGAEPPLRLDASPGDPNPPAGQAAGSGTDADTAAPPDAGAAARCARATAACRPDETAERALSRVMVEVVDACIRAGAHFTCGTLSATFDQHGCFTTLSHSDGPTPPGNAALACVEHELSALRVQCAPDQTGRTSLSCTD